jgi:hypothetical protein
VGTNRASSVSISSVKLRQVLWSSSHAPGSYSGGVQSESHTPAKMSGGFHDSSVPSTKCQKSTFIRSILLPSKSFPNYHPFNNVPIDGTQSTYRRCCKITHMHTPAWERARAHIHTHTNKKTSLESGCLYRRYRGKAMGHGGQQWPLRMGDGAPDGPIRIALKKATALGLDEDE